MPIASTRCLRSSGRRSSALAGRVIGAMMSGLAALARLTSVERSDGGSGHEMTSTMSHGGLAALCAAWKPLAWFVPKRSLQCMRTTRRGETPASLKMSVKYCTARCPKSEPVGKLRYTYWTFCWPSLTARATFAVIGSAAEMSTRKGTRRCWATGTIAAVSPELNVPMRIWAPALMRRSASVRATSGLVCASPSIRARCGPPTDRTRATESQEGARPPPLAGGRERAQPALLREPGPLRPHDARRDAEALAVPQQLIGDARGVAEQESIAREDLERTIEALPGR